MVSFSRRILRQHQIHPPQGIAERHSGCVLWPAPSSSEISVVAGPGKLSSVLTLQRDHEDARPRLRKSRPTLVSTRTGVHAGDTEIVALTPPRIVQREAEIADLADADTVEEDGGADQPRAPSHRTARDRSRTARAPRYCAAGIRSRTRRRSPPRPETPTTTKGAPRFSISRLALVACLHQGALAVEIGPHPRDVRIATIRAIAPMATILSAGARPPRGRRWYSNWRGHG